MDVETLPEPQESKPGKVRKAGVKRKNRTAWVIAGSVIGILAIAIAALVIVRGQRPVSVAAADTTVLAKTTLRDSISATGTVASANTYKVYSTLTYAVDRIYVSVGQVVAQGDKLCDLNTTTLDKQISSKLALIDQTAGTSAASIRSAQDKYDAAVAAVANGTNASLINANTAMVNAYNAYQKAQKAYDDFVALLDPGQIAQWQDLKSAFDTAKDALISAKDAYDAAVAGPATPEELAAALDAYNAAQVTYDAAKAAYSAVATKYNTLADLKLAVDSTYDSYKNAQAAYEAAQASVQTDLQLSLDALRSSQASGSNQAALQDLANLNQDRSSATVTAPMAGTVTAVYANVGANAAGLAFVIEDTQHLIINTSVKEYDVVTVKPGMPVTIESDATRTAVYDGRVATIAPTSDKDATGKTITGSDIQYATKVDVVSAQTDLRIGMNVRLNYVLGSASDVLVVPIDAVYTNAQGVKSILVAIARGDGRSTLQEYAVTVGLSNDLRTVISGAGITDGLRVINAPTKYAPGAIVTIS